MNHSTKKLNSFLVAVLVMVFLLLGIGKSFIYQAEAAIREEINYQGKLSDSSGFIVPDGSYSMTFRLYTVASGGTHIWTETQSVTVASGLFSVMLGSSTALTGVDFNQTLYLGVNVDGDGEMSPRKVLGAVPAAFEAKNASTVGGVASTSFLRSDEADTLAASTAGTLLTVTQSGVGDILNLFDGATEVFSVLDGGNVGIGTTTPFTKLSVAGNGFFGGNLTATGTLTVSGTTTLATTTIASSTITRINIAGDSITDFSGTGLSVSGGALTLNATGDWTGTFDGQEGSYYLNAANLTGTLASGRLSGSYTGITGVGTVTAGTWQGTAITDAYVADALTIAGGTINSTTIGATTPSTAVFTSATTTSATTTNLAISSFISGRVPYATTGGALTASSSFTYDGTTLTMTSYTNFGTMLHMAPNLTTNPLFTLIAPLTTGVGDGKAFQISSTNDSFGRSIFYTDGSFGIGPGYATRDVFLSRSATSTIRISSDRSTGAATLDVTGDITVGGTVDGKDIATNAAMLNEAETISSNWVNTANPWADNEVADALTIAGGTINSTTIGATTPSTAVFTSATTTSATTTNLAILGLTSGRVPYITTGGRLTNGANLTFDGTNLVLGTDVGLSRGAANRLDIATGDSLNLVSGSYQIGSTNVLTSTTLGSGITSSSLTTLGTLTGLTVSGTTTLATTTIASSTITRINIAGDSITDFSGTGLSVSGGALTLNATGDWTGTFDGQEGSYYLNAANLTGTLASGRLSGSYTGITGVGTVTAGTWQGTAIASAYLDSTVILSSEIDTSSELAGVLGDETGSGTAVFSIAPAFSGTATFSALSATSTITLSGSAANIALGSNWLSGDGADEGVYVTGGGNVGIGTSTPGSLLTVAGQFSATNGAYANEIYGAGATSAGAASSTVIGFEAQVTGTAGAENYLAIGTRAIASGFGGNVAVGPGAQVQGGSGSVAFGSQAVTTSGTSVAIGSESYAYGYGAIALGYGTEAAQESIAIGAYATAATGQVNISASVADDSSPSLTISGAADAWTSRPLFQATTDWLDAADASRRAQVRLSTFDSAAERFFLQADATGSGVTTSFNGGSVGIGTSTPTQLLHVQGTARISGALYDNNNSAGTSGMVLQTTGSGFAWVATSTLGLGSGASGHDPVTLAGTPNYITLSGQQLTLTALDIADDLNTFSSSALGGRLTDETGVGGVAVFSAGPSLTGTTTVAHLVSSGRFGVGTTSPGRMLTVAGTAHITGALYDNNNSAGTSGMVLQTTGSGFAWVATSTLGLTGGGASTFLALSDTPSSFTANRLFFTNSGGTAVTDSANLTYESDGLHIDGDNNALFLGDKMIYASSTTGGLIIGRNAWAGTAINNNIAIGDSALESVTTGSANLYIGNNTGNQVTTGSYNVVFAPALAGQNLSTGSFNILIGYAAGYGISTNSGITAIGMSAGNYLRSGDANSLYGEYAGAYLATSTNSTVIGSYAAFGNYTEYDADELTVVGAAAGENMTTGADRNTLFGYHSGGGITTGANNVTLGYRAGENITTGSNNLMFGYDIDAASTTRSYQLNIGNLLFGTDVDGTGTTLSSGNIGIGTTTPSAKLGVAGTIELTLSTTGTTNNAVCWDNAGSTLLYDCDGTPADYAESYPTTPGVEYGEIVMITDEQVEQTDGAYVPRVTEADGSGAILGITSDNYHDFTSAGQDLLDASDHPLPVALVGRVPVKVNLEGGEIAIGDRIVLSSEEGVGRRATTSGETVVGIAMATYTAEDTHGTVLVFVQNNEFSTLADKARRELWSLDLAAAGESVFDDYFAVETADTIWRRVATLAEGFVDGVLQVAGLRTRELCLYDENGETCINRAELDTLLGGSELEGLTGGDDSSGSLPPLETPAEGGTDGAPGDGVTEGGEAVPDGEEPPVTDVPPLTPTGETGEPAGDTSSETPEPAA